MTKKEFMEAVKEAKNQVKVFVHEHKDAIVIGTATVSTVMVVALIAQAYENGRNDGTNQIYNTLVTNLPDLKEEIDAALLKDIIECIEKHKTVIFI